MSLSLMWLDFWLPACQAIPEGISVITGGDLCGCFWNEWANSFAPVQSVAIEPSGSWQELLSSSRQMREDPEFVAVWEGDCSYRHPLFPIFIHLPHLEDNKFPSLLFFKDVSFLFHPAFQVKGGEDFKSVCSFSIMFESLIPVKGHSPKGEQSISHSLETRKIVFYHINRVID